MRLTRVLTIAVTSLALLLPLSAATGISADAAAKPHRHITAKVTKPHATLHLHARVSNYSNHHTFLEKRSCASCGWNTVAHRSTNGTGRVSYPLGAPATGRWYYRMGTPANHQFARSYSPKFYTYRT